MTPYKILRRGLFLFDGELMHQLSLVVLKAGLMLPYPAARDPRLRVSAFGLEFDNPVGMGAGFDKNGEVIDAVLRIGCGYTEIGTVTPRPQPGNPRPRMVRLPLDEALINRMGFNNAGHAAVRARLVARGNRGGIVGVNIGANRDSADRIADYVAGVEAFADVASYLAVNISSPNTPGLRDLQARASLATLLDRVMSARDAAAERLGRGVPVLLKISPDLHDEELQDVVEEVKAHRVDGLIISNTTIARDDLGLVDPRRGEPGGLSGKPLFERSTRVLARARQIAGPDLPIIGVGGIDSVETALAKITAGATLIQIYTGMIYEGPSLADSILSGLVARLKRDNLPSLASLVGRDQGMWL
jgi:dihydroorotate dehydrogenase